VARVIHGAWLDAFVYAEAAFTVIDPDLLRFLPAPILVDERGFARTLIERVEALNQKGPLLLPEGEDEMVRVWYAKMLVRIARSDLATADEVIQRSDGSHKMHKNLEAGLAQERGISCLGRIKETLCAGSKCGCC
jgi:hypothetical protein